MSKHLRNDLEKIEKHLLHLAGHVEQAVRRAMEALRERRVGLAQEVIAGDIEIDRREVELEEECLKVLALHQPVAHDLRFTAACLKIDNDLERIGDLAANIAKRAVSLAETSAMPIPSSIDGMVETVLEMLRDSMDCFVKGDVELARYVLARDDRVDGWNSETISGLVRSMSDGTTTIDQGLLLISVSKGLERIADHTTNIAEDVIYLVEGEIVRHQPVDES
jgi:phosphate transport system protein